MNGPSLSLLPIRGATVGQDVAQHSPPARDFDAVLKMPGEGGAGRTSAPGPLQGGTTRATVPGGGRGADSVEGSQLVTQALARIRQDERRLDRYVKRALRGGDFSLQELVAMQSVVYRYSQRVEMLSKLVERVTGAVKQALRTPV